jgi:hypothetical protein
MWMFWFFLLICAVYVPFLLKYMKKKKAEQEEFLRTNPGAAKVYTKLGIGSLYSAEAITVTGVNDESPMMFYDGLWNGQGFFLLPGTSVVDVEYARTRPGILYKTVTTRTGPTRQELTAEANKRYRLGFNRKEECYVFEELN